MSRKARVVLQDDTGFISAEVVADCVTFQDSRGGLFVSVPSAFLKDVVDVYIEVSGDDSYAALEAQLAAETERRMIAETSARVLEGQLAAMRALLQPKPVEKLADVED